MIKRCVVFVSLLAALCGTARADDFPGNVDVERFERIAIQHQQTVKTFDTFSRQVLTEITGRGSLEGRPASVTVLDIAFRPEAYQTANIIKIKAVPVREVLRDELTRAKVIDAAEGKRLYEKGTISLELWRRPETFKAMRDLIQSDARKSEAVAEVDQAATMLEMIGGGDFALFRFIPPAPGSGERLWHNLGDCTGNFAAYAQSLQANGLTAKAPLAGYDNAALLHIGEEFGALIHAWRDKNGPEASRHLDTLAGQLAEVNSDQYPSASRRGVELFYNRMFKFTLPGAAFYFLAFVCFLAGARSGVSGLRKWGLRFFITGYTIHTLGIAIRWWLVAGQHESWFYGIPIKNQFESVLMSCWFGATIGLVLELALKPKIRGIIGSAVAFVGWIGLVAIFSAPYIADRDIGGEINQVTGVLMSYWLYIHVTMATASYALITASFVLGVWWLIKYYLTQGGLSAGPANDQSAAASTFLITLDQCNLVLLQLAFWILGTAIVLGAVWADESWGRPWGWDPKETFALVTWIVYLVIVHVRVATHNKAWWTAVLSIVGFFVMLFNWIGVNFFLVGLHSYA